MDSCKSLTDKNNDVLEGKGVSFPPFSGEIAISHTPKEIHVCANDKTSHFLWYLSLVLLSPNT